MFSFPYYVLFEWLTPFIEISGLLFLFIVGAMGYLSLMLIPLVLLIYWVVGSALNITSLSVEAITRGHYKDSRTLLKLFAYAFLEPLFNHWINSFIYVTGNFRLVFLNKKSWGQMDGVELHKIPVKSQEINEEGEMVV